METSDGIMPKGRKSEMLSFYITIKQKVQSSNKLLMLSSYSNIISHEYRACDTFHENFIKCKTLYLNS